MTRQQLLHVECPRDLLQYKLGVGREEVGAWQRARHGHRGYGWGHCGRKGINKTGAIVVVCVTVRRRRFE